MGRFVTSVHPSAGNNLIDVRNEQGPFLYLSRWSIRGYFVWIRISCIFNYGIWARAWRKSRIKILRTSYVRSVRNWFTFSRTNFLYIVFRIYICLLCWHGGKTNKTYTYNKTMKWVAKKLQITLIFLPPFSGRYFRVSPVVLLSIKCLIRLRNLLAWGNLSIDFDGFYIILQGISVSLVPVRTCCVSYVKDVSYQNFESDCQQS